MRIPGLVAVVVGSLLLLAPAASAQQDQGPGWRGAIDQLNRAVNPDAQPDDRDRRDRDRRYEGSSGDTIGRNDGNRDDARSSAFRRHSDADLRDRWERLADEQRQLQRERRALEDEMERRGLRR